MPSTHTRRNFLSARAYEVSCRVRVGEATRPALSSGEERRRLHPKEPQATPVRSRWTGGSPASIQIWFPPAYGWSSARLGEGGTPPVAWRTPGDASGFCWSRHLLRHTAFPSRSFGKAPGKPHNCAGQKSRDRSVSGPLSFRYVSYLTLSAAGERR